MSVGCVSEWRGFGSFGNSADWMPTRLPTYSISERLIAQSFAPHPGFRSTHLFLFWFG
jgi:hypothetical protein